MTKTYEQEIARFTREAQGCASDLRVKIAEAITDGFENAVDTIVKERAAEPANFYSCAYFSIACSPYFDDDEDVREFFYTRGYRG